MEDVRQPLIVRLTVHNHARLACVLNLGGVLVAVSAAIQREMPGASWSLFAVGMAVLLLALAMLGRKTDQGEQSLSVSAQGLQIGTLFKNVRGDELYDYSFKGSEATLRSRVLTLELKGRDVDAAALRGCVGTLRIGNQGKRGNLGMITGLVAGAAVSLPLALLGGHAGRAALHYAVVLSFVINLIPPSIALLRFRRAGSRF